MMREKIQPFNVIRNPADVSEIERVYECAGKNCTRTMVMYRPAYQGVAESRHARGLPVEMMEQIRELGKPIIEVLCDHHGGFEYKTPSLR
jgi:hypothetical protein